MSLLMQAYILEKYGPRLDVEQLADVLSMAPGTIHNQVSLGTFQVPTYVDGKKRFADHRDVAAYLDRVRELAA